MIKDIIDQFMFRKERGSPAGSRLERLAPETEDSSDIPLRTMEPPPKEATDDHSTVEVGRELLLSLLQKSRQKKIRVSRELLEQLNWQGATTSADFPLSNPQAYRYEAKFHKANFVIDGIDYEECSDDAQCVRERKKSPVPFGFTPLKASTIGSPKSISTRFMTKTFKEETVSRNNDAYQKVTSEKATIEHAVSNEAHTSQHPVILLAEVKQPTSRLATKQTPVTATSGGHHKSAASAKKQMPKKVCSAQKLSLCREATIPFFRTKPEVLTSAALGKQVAVLVAKHPRKQSKKSIGDAMKIPTKGLMIEKSLSKDRVSFVSKIEEASRSTSTKAATFPDGKTGGNDQTVTPSLKQPMVNIDLSKKGGEIEKSMSEARVAQRTSNLAGEAFDGKMKEATPVAPKKALDRAVREATKAPMAVAPVKEDDAQSEASVNKSLKRQLIPAEKTTVPSSPKPIQEGSTNKKKNGTSSLTLTQPIAIKKETVSEDTSMAKSGGCVAGAREQAVQDIAKKIRESAASRKKKVVNAAFEKRKDSKADRMSEAKACMEFSSKKSTGPFMPLAKEAEETTMTRSDSMKGAALIVSPKNVEPERNVILNQPPGQVPNPVKENAEVSLSIPVNRSLLTSMKAPAVQVSSKGRAPIVQDLIVFPHTGTVESHFSSEDEVGASTRASITICPRKNKVVDNVTVKSIKNKVSSVTGKEETVNVRKIDASTADERASSLVKYDRIVHNYTAHQMMNVQFDKEVVASVRSADLKDTKASTSFTTGQESSKSDDKRKPAAVDLLPTLRPRLAKSATPTKTGGSHSDAAGLQTKESDMRKGDLTQKEVTTQEHPYVSSGASHSDGKILSSVQDPMLGVSSSSSEKGSLRRYSKRVERRQDLTVRGCIPLAALASSKRGEKRKSAEDLSERAATLDQEFVSNVDSIHLPNSVIDVKGASSGESSVKKRKKRRNQFLLKELEAFGNPGILYVCHKPKVFSSQLHFRPARGKNITNLLIEQLSREMPQYKNEIPVVDKAGDVLKKQHPNCIIDPLRVERGYFKTHLDSEFVDSFASSMPECIRIKRTVTKKGIAFVSTVATTLSHTHYDQDTSFLLLLSGTKEIFYAPPSMADRLRQDHPVLSHSSIFEFVNPFVEAAGTLWKFTTLRAGDGLLLPQGWLHAVKSTPGTIAISFQVEASGIDATSPFTRRPRFTAPEDLRHLTSMTMDSDLEKHLKMEAENSETELGSRAAEERFSPEMICKKLHPVLAGKKPPSLSSKVCDKTRERDDTCLDLIHCVPLEVKSETLGLSSTSKKSGIRNASASTMEKRRSLNFQPPSILRVSYPSSKRKSIPASYVFPTKKMNHSESMFSTTSARRSKRQKHYCGVEGCKNMFPANNGLMWVMVLQLGCQDVLDLPAVPTFHPKHLICCGCRETNGQAIFAPEEVLNEQDKDEIRGWDKYRYYAATKADYEKWADHDGENGKLLAATL